MEIRKIYIQAIMIMMAGFLCACGGKKQEEFSLSGAIEGREEPSLAESREDNDKKGRWEKGYFCYELCVPEPPEVSEIVDGSCLVRVRPLPQECREMSEKCVLPLGYQGNNLLCSNWDRESLDKLDYNGIYEYFYGMKYDRRFEPEQYPHEIPAEEFEETIMDYLSVSREEIRQWAVFDEGRQVYRWERLGCGNYAPSFFGTSVPEVTQIRENEDGTFTLTVDAVCQMILCNDAVITHELTVRLSENGDIQYLENRILDDGIFNIPEYQYRIGK